MGKVKVNLKENSYDILIGSDCLAELGKLVQAENWGREVIIVTDGVVNDLYGHSLRKTFKGKTKTLEIPRGERQKNFKTAEKLYDELLRYGAHRDSILIALGGGVIGDLTGFVAATYMRGINYIQVPTTLLSQVDASIGGKTGINHPKSKNLVGSFYQPKAVFIDVNTLSSLPFRELRTGLAEVVKYGVIEDAEFFKFLEANAHHLNTRGFENEDTKRAALKLWQTIVTESAKIKARIVEKDEKEAGLRRVLNYGHTIGHAVEALTHFRTYNHGEAVSIGMVAAAMIANRLQLIESSEVSRIKDLLEKLSLPVEIEGLSYKRIIGGMAIDKKVSAGKLNFVLPEKMGKITIKDDVPVNVIKQVLLEMGAK